LTPRITIGLPAYKGADLITKCIESLQRQTFGDFKAIISVDGGDTETAAACRSFLADPRFQMVVQAERLEWFGNFNWLLQQDLQEFFCYRQHDDTTAPEFFELLLQAADKEPSAAIVYCDCQYTGGRNDLEIARSIEGEPLDRMLQYIERIPPTPIRGLIRKDAIRQAGLVRSSALADLFVWLAKLVRWGNFRRVAKPLYYRLDHARNYSKDLHRWPEDQKRAAMTSMFTGLLEAAIPLCRSTQERLYVQQVILDRVVIYRPERLSIYRQSNELDSSRKLIDDCLERLKDENNGHLLTKDELPKLFQEFQLNRRLDEAKLLERSRLRRAIYRIRQRSRMCKIIHPRSRVRRATYQIRELLFEVWNRCIVCLNVLKEKAGGLLLAR